LFLPHTLFQSHKPCKDHNPNPADTRADAPNPQKEFQSMNLETKKLKAALERLCLVVPKKGTLPVLENLRWRVVRGHLELTATDLDNSLHISRPSAAPVMPNSVDVLVTAKEL